MEKKKRKKEKKEKKAQVIWCIYPRWINLWDFSDNIYVDDSGHHITVVG